MPAWVSLILWNIVLPDLVLWLRNKGYTNAAEDLTSRAVISVVQEVKSIKTYSQPSDFPKEPNDP